LTAGMPEFMEAGYHAQLKSIVLLKNKGKILPLVKKGITVYVPQRYTPATTNWFGRVVPEKTELPINIDILKKYFTVTDDPAKADLGIVFARSPMAGTGYDKKDREAGGNGYVPISLQYRPYKAEHARANSIAAGDPVIDSTITNRSYLGKTVLTSNESDLKMIQDTRYRMQGKPLIVVVNISNPMVFAEFEKEVDVIVASFGVQDMALLDIITGAAEPSGLLPVQMPNSMKTVEQQMEDLPHDMDVHVDSEGNKYDFGFGLNWKGVINDARVKKYKVQKKAGF